METLNFDDYNDDNWWSHQDEMAAQHYSDQARLAIADKLVTALQAGAGPGEINVLVTKYMSTRG